MIADRMNLFHFFLSFLSCLQVLDMSDGTVAFRAGSRDNGVAMKGLKHLSTGFYVAASMDEPGDSIRMTYLGSLGK